MNSTLAKYSAALLQFSIVVVAALAQLTHHLTLVDALQLIALATNAVVVYFAPLFGVAMRSGWKVGGAVVVAVVNAAIPLVLTHTFTGQQISIVALAGLQVLAAHVGVQIRNDTDAATYVVNGAGTAAPIAEPPTDTTITNAVTANGGEFLGESAR